ncbi:MAG: SCO family protein [Candidatus Krumholzibacteria bacterium]|nr:SCO family protein [Candidatus Krumholzibacteria bacterium]MDP6668608.1 SCO family protein [Candidatus Krumholzibacteria bacterium]MDP6796321.1 SCO family protein [Candidatus Krumholzibacteria bacterium]MDP7021324.1 SCO family protein [Candidatus Krumholzibacteria bacterium]
MSFRFSYRLGLLLLALAILPVLGERQESEPAELEGIGIDDRAGAQLPLDLVFRDSRGEMRELGEFFDGEHPVLLSLVYYNCPMLCNLVLDSMIAGLRDLEWSAGEEFSILTVSIDPRDSVEDSAQKRSHLLASYGREGSEDAWKLLTASSEVTRALADSLGFRYRFDEETGEYLHAAGIFALSPDGKLSRCLYGVDYPERDLRLSLLEAGEGRIGKARDHFLLYCFAYDPEQGAYSLQAMNIMRAGGSLTLLLLGAFLLKRKRRADESL